jgi:hypothetical protein
VTTFERQVQEIAEYAPEFVHQEIPDIVTRALAAGAQPPLEYMGVGMTAVVLCDAENTAWKVGRPHREAETGYYKTRLVGNVSLTLYSLLEDEAEWLALANQIPWVQDHVARFYAWHPREAIIERECVRGKTGSWGKGGTIWDIAKAIEQSMLPYGWSAPEVKEDSYVLARGRGWVVVDAGFVHRAGRALVEQVVRALRGEEITKASTNLNTLAFDVRMERGRTIPPKVADKLLERLYAQGAAR